MTKSKLGLIAVDGGSVHTGYARSKSQPAPKISPVFRQEVIRRADGRCQMCGSTVMRHGATLVVDDNKPGNWGDADELGSFWAICEECYAGREAYFSSVNVDAELIRRVTAHESVHMRIGELLKAIGIGKRVPSSLIEDVAGQSGWKKRLRELRYPVIGWKIEAHLYNGPSGRKRSDYILMSHRPWPQDPTGAIRRFRGIRKKWNGATPLLLPNFR